MLAVLGWEGVAERAFACDGVARGNAPDLIEDRVPSVEGDREEGRSFRPSSISTASAEHGVSASIGDGDIAFCEGEVRDL
jgi:hypothetical protein